MILAGWTEEEKNAPTGVLALEGAQQRILTYEHSVYHIVSVLCKTLKRCNISGL
jgi:hypothetical protein